VCVWYVTEQGQQSIVQLRLGGPDVLGAGFNIQASDDESGKLVISEVLSSASDVLRSLMNAGLYHTFLFSDREIKKCSLETPKITGKLSK